MQLNRKIISLSILLIVSFCFELSAQNLINNPGFENGIAGWAKNMNNGASVSFTTDTLNSPEGDKHLKGIVSKLGSNDWDVQLRSNAFAVNQTHQYRLTFKAKSQKSGTVLKVYIQKNKWMGKSFTLSDSWASYSYDFFPDENSKELKFNLVEVAEYYIDDIVLEDVTPVNNLFNTPPSCVITAPHVNAYYQIGNTIKINVYATDMGGSGKNGEISKVEFFIDNQKIGESETPVNHTYSINWNAATEGEFRITAKATDNENKTFTSAGVLLSVGTEKVKEIGLSSGKGKYLGNVVRNSGIEPTFTDCWNAVTSGNGGKWQTIERTRNVMDWQKADMAHNLAKINHLPYRYHTLAWGSQYPEWIKTLAPAQFQAEMEEFIQAVANRFPYIDQIDVINEALPGHQNDTKYFIDGLGGAGESGYDWAVWLFKKARQYFPNSKLVLNDFGMVNSSGSIRGELLILKALRDSALVDGFGAQAHTFSLDNVQPNALKQNLDLMSTSGVPIYITEMDMQGKNTDEASQLTSYKNLFPVLWEHPAVAGITLWGYIYGDMWKPYAGLVNKNGSDRSCMVWLKSYLEQQEDVGYPLWYDVPAQTTTDSQATNQHILVYPNPSKGKVTLTNHSNNRELVTIYTAFGRRVDQFEIFASSKIDRSLSPGMYLVNINGQESFKLIVNE